MGARSKKGANSATLSAVRNGASDAVRRMNPGLFGGPIPQGKTLVEVFTEEKAAKGPESPGKPQQAHTKVRTAKGPKTRPEREMGLMLMRRRMNSEILSYEFEGVTLSIGDGIRYTPDFAAIAPDGRFVFIEVKGPYIRRSGLQAFKAAKGKYTNATFELWQLVKSEWKQIV